MWLVAAAVRTAPTPKNMSTPHHNAKSAAHQDPEPKDDTIAAASRRGKGGTGGMTKTDRGASSPFPTHQPPAYLPPRRQAQIIGFCSDPFWEHF